MLRARLQRGFQAVDIESIAKPVTNGPSVREPACAARLPAGLPPDALRLSRSVPIDLPFDVQMAEIEFDLDTYEPLPAYCPRPPAHNREGARHAGRGRAPADCRRWRRHQRRRLRAARRIYELTGVPAIPTLMGRGTILDDHPLMAGMVGLQLRITTATRRCWPDFVLGIGNRWANRHRLSRGTPRAASCPRGYRANPDRTRLARLRHRVRCERGATAIREGGEGTQGRRSPQARTEWVAECRERKRTMLRRPTSRTSR